MLLLKKLIADRLVKDLIKKISIDQLDVESGVVKTTISPSYKKTKEYSLIELMSLKNSTIAAEMLKDGYILVQIKGGYLVVSPTGTEYQITDEMCTCPDFVVARNNQSQCKHLIFRDWHIDYLKRVELYKLENVKY